MLRRLLILQHAGSCNMFKPSPRGVRFSCRAMSGLECNSTVGAVEHRAILSNYASEQASPSTTRVTHGSSYQKHRVPDIDSRNMLVSWPETWTQNSRVLVSCKDCGGTRSNRVARPARAG